MRRTAPSTTKQTTQSPKSWGNQSTSRCPSWSALTQTWSWTWSTAGRPPTPILRAFHSGIFSLMGRYIHDHVHLWNGCVIQYLTGVHVRCPYHDDRYLTTLVPIDGSSGLLYPTHHKRFIIKMFTFVDQSDFSPQKDTVRFIAWSQQSLKLNLISSIGKKFKLWTSPRCSSIVPRRCVIRAALNPVNRHAIVNVSNVRS